MKKIAFIAPDYNMLEIAKTALAEDYQDIFIVKGLLSEGVAMAKKLADAGVEVLISRGQTADLIRTAKLPVTVIEVDVTAFDLLRAVKNAMAKSDKIAVVAFAKMASDIELLLDLLQMKFAFYILKKETDVAETVAQALKDGAQVVIGGVVTGEAAKKQKCLFEIIQTGSESVRQAAREAVSVYHARKVEKEKSGLFRTVLDCAYEGIISINQDGIITVFNPMAEKLTGLLQEDATGREIKKILPVLQLEKLVEVPSERFGQIIRINGKDIVCNQMPIQTKSGILGAVATLMDVGKVQQMEAKVREKLFLSGHVATKTHKDIVGESSIIKKAVYTARQYALTESAVLIFGETGSGKEVFAQMIHNYSNRKDKAFVAINCAALPGQILESELFGYMPGAFTGASQKGKPGLFEIAHGGTVFLDEIAEMDIAIQSKLLRVLEEKKVMRLGSDRLLPVDVRIIAASNKELKVCVKEQTFRQDLYYRLNVLKLMLPPLKKRKEDIKQLCEHFFSKQVEQAKQPKLSPGSLKVLKSYDWPGNVRELQNILQRLIALYGETQITEERVRAVLLEDLDENSNEQFAFKDEQAVIAEALKRCSGHYGKAAELLGMHRATLWRKMKKYGWEDGKG